MLQIGQCGDDGQFFSAKPAISNCQLRQAAQRRKKPQGVKGLIGNLKGFQIGQLCQVIAVFRFFGNRKRTDVPQFTGIQRLSVVSPDQLADSAFNCGILEHHFFNHAADGISVNAARTDQTIVVHAYRINQGLTAAQGNGIRKGGILNRRIFSVGRIIYGAGGSGEAHRDILAVKAGEGIGHGSGRADGIDLCLDGRIGDVVKHIYRIQQFILLHIGFAKCNIKLCRTAIGNCIGERILCLGVIAVSLKLVSQLNGNILILTGVPVSQIIKPGCNFGIAVGGMIAGLLKQHIPGKVSVINKAVPKHTGNDQKCQQNRYQPFG